MKSIEQEPAFYIVKMELELLQRDGRRAMVLYTKPITNGIEVPVYTTPPQKSWIGLTKEEVEDIEIAWEATSEWSTFGHAVRYIEAKIREKNQ